MKAFTFRLARVLRVRLVERDKARAEWATARAVQAKVERRLADLRSQAAAEAAGMGPGTVMTPEEMRGTAFRANQRARAAEAALVDLADAVKETDARALVLAEATRRVDALEHLQARHRDVWAADVRRAETRAMDDIANTRARRVPMGASR